MAEQVTTCRDLTLVTLNEQEVLVIACDSLGGIGTKEHDRVKAPPSVLGIFTARVPLMEVIAAGARPMVVVNTLSVEMNPTGDGIVAGIREEIARSGLSADISVTGSREENIKTCQTALGVTVIGRAFKSQLRMGRSRPGDLVACLGAPKVGDEVLDGTPKADLLLLQKLIPLSWVREIQPVGSKGVRYEAELLADGSGTCLKLLPEQEIDLEKSAGPSTCLLVSLDGRHFARLQVLTDLPAYKIGRLC